MFRFYFMFKICNLYYTLGSRNLYISLAGFINYKPKRDEKKKSLLIKSAPFIEYAEDTREKFPEWNAS